MGRGDIATSYYAPVSPWHAPGIRPYPEHDPEKARFLLRQAKAKGTPIALQSLRPFPTCSRRENSYRPCGPMSASRSSTTFTNCQCCDKSVVIGTLMPSPRRAAIALIRMAGSRVICCQQLRRRRSFQGFRSERADKLIVEARQTINKQKRLELYAEIESIVNEELPYLYIHNLTLLEAGVMNLKGYQPAASGLFTTKGGGIRTAWLA